MIRGWWRAVIKHRCPIHNAPLQAQGYQYEACPVIDCSFIMEIAGGNKAKYGKAHEYKRYGRIF